MQLTSFLTEWLIGYIKHKDIMTQKIQDIAKSEGHVIVTYSDKTHIFLIEPYIQDMDSTLKKLAELKGVHKDAFSSIVMFNSESNIKQVIDKWNMLINDPKFSIYFVNPFSNTDKRWIIHPYTHDKITEKPALKQGLLSLFSGVESINEETAKRLIHQSLHQENN